MNNPITYNVEGITLKTYNLSDYDRIFVIFSREKGLIRAVGKSVRKPNSKFGGMLEPMNINNLLLRKGKNLEQIYQCEIVKSFINIRNDYDKLIYSLFILELIINFIHEGEIAEDIYDLLVYTLELLDKSENILEILIWFELFFLKLIGYENNYNTCNICQKKLNDKYLGFDIYSGNINCNSCINKETMIIDIELLNIIKRIKDNDLNINNDKSLEKIQGFLKLYISNLSEKKIKTLDMMIGK